MLTKRSVKSAVYLNARSMLECICSHQVEALSLWFRIHHLYWLQAAESTVPVRSKGYKDPKWAVLIAEYGAPIEYKKEAHNIRTDMLSRIQDPTLDISLEDTTKLWFTA